MPPKYSKAGRGRADPGHSATQGQDAGKFEQRVLKSPARTELKLQPTRPERPSPTPLQAAEPHHESPKSGSSAIIPVQRSPSRPRGQPPMLSPSQPGPSAGRGLGPPRPPGKSSVWNPRPLRGGHAGNTGRPNSDKGLLATQLAPLHYQTNRMGYDYKMMGQGQHLQWSPWQYGHPQQYHPFHSRPQAMWENSGPYQQPPPPQQSYESYERERHFKKADSGGHSRHSSGGQIAPSPSVDLAAIYTEIQALFPKLNPVLLRMGAAILVENLSSHSEAQHARFVHISHLKAAVEMLNQEPHKAKEIIIDAFKSVEKIVGTADRVPEVIAKEVESAVRHLLTDPCIMLPSADSSEASKKATEARKFGTKVIFPKAAVELLEQKALHNLHLEALKHTLQDLEQLLATPVGFAELPDVAFGLVRMAPETPPSAYAGRFGLPLPELTKILKGGAPTPSLQPSENDQPTAMRFRNIRLTSKGGTATLIDVRAYPEYMSRFAIMDDNDFARSAYDGIEQSQGAVKLQEGEDFDLTLVLDTRDGYHRSAEKGLLQQLILYTVVSNQIPTKVASNWRLLKDKKTAVIVFACRVSAVLTAHVEDMKALLNSEATPFVPKHLSTLFDSPPALHHADLPPLDPLFSNRGMVGEVCSWTRTGSAPLRASPPANANQGMTQILRQSPAFNSSSFASDSKAAEYNTNIRKYSRLLILEETAMEDQIRRYDMFNIRCQFAVFEPSTKRPQYRIHTVLPNKHSNFDLNARKKDYRGPQLSSLYPEEDMTGCCPRRILTVIEVPGLPEDRPSLKFGDTVHIRFADAGTTEFTGYVIVTESSHCLVAMPKEFYACCVSSPRSFAENTTIEKLTGLSEDKIKGAEFTLLHVRFGFDRGAMKRMHEALAAANLNPGFHCLPPAVEKKAAPQSIEIAGLPSDEDFFAAVGNSLPSKNADSDQNTGPSVYEVRQKVREIKEVGKQELNAEQKWAISSFLAAANMDCPFTIYGPPGTGKTVTLVECALQILKSEPGAKLLLCAPQGYSADLLASALGQAGVSSEDIMRLADPRHPPPQMKDDVFQKFSNFDERLRAFALPAPSELAKKRVIVMTCGAAGILRTGDYKKFHDLETTKWRRGDVSKLVGLQFSHVLVDEAGQPKLGKALLCGDPKQLGPVVSSLHAGQGNDGNGLSSSLLEAFLEYNAASATTKKAAGSVPATATLVQNYRSHHTLLELPNKLFYSGQLVAAAKQDLVCPPEWSLAAQSSTDAEQKPNGRQNGGFGGFFDLDSFHSGLHDSLESPKQAVPPSTIFYGVRGQQMREGEAPSFFNPMEATMLVDLLERLLHEQEEYPAESRITSKDIGVIATYRKQVQKIRILLRIRNLAGIRVGTVDDLQGQEERVIFISTVLSNPESLPPRSAVKGPDGRLGDLQVGFWRNPRRFNVAITRAKALLVVLGHPITLLEDDCWRELMRYCKDKGTFRGEGQIGISQLLHSKELSEMQAAFDGPTKGDSGIEEVAVLVNRAAEILLLGSNESESRASHLEESMAAFQSEVQWRMVL